MHRSVLGICLCLLVACGSTSSGDPDAGAVDAAWPDALAVVDAAPPDATPTLTLDDLCGLDGGYVAFFDALLACHPEFELFLGRLPTPAEISAACYGNFGPYFDDGTMTLGDYEQWLTCLDYIGSLDCTTAEFDAPNPCSVLIVGSQSEGDDCEQDEQCAGDAYCDLAGDGCGACAPRKPDWAPCSDGNQCASRLCDSTYAVCRPFGQVGAMCADDEECLGRLRCDVDGTGLCVEPMVWEVGDPCTSYEDDCGFPLSELFCNVTALGGPNQCAEYFSVGDPCVSSYQCDFRRYEICDTADTDECLAPTIVAENASCAWLDGTRCDAGFRCTDPTGTSGVCVAEPQIGDSCLSADDCGLLMVCDQNDECAYGDYSGMCPALD